MRGVQTAARPETPVALCRLIGMTHGEIVRGLEQALLASGSDLNFTQYLALKLLGEHGPMTPGELARTLNYNPGSLTRLLDKLQEAGYLQRAPHPSDRRSLRLELTAAARKKHARIITCAETAAQKAFAGFTETERRELRDLLTRLLDHLHKLREPSVSG